MATTIALHPPQPFVCELRPPGSKSLTNRALLLAALARGRSRLSGWLAADDTEHMRRCLGQFGIAITEDASGRLVIDGAGGPLPARPQAPELFVGTAGTAARFLLAALAASPGSAKMDGTPRMRERPMETLIEALRSLGARIRCTELEGCLPVEVGPHDRPLHGGEVRLPHLASSQFVSGLLFAALLGEAPTRIVLEHGTPARPYVDMTVALMERFGARAKWLDPHVLMVEPSQLHAIDYEVEPDASAASYLLGLAAIYAGRTTIPHLGTDSLQGDVGFARVLASMGATVEQTPTSTTVIGGPRLHGREIDLSEMPDMTLTLAVVALFAEGPTRITGVGILRHHESDRLAAAATELRKLGADVVEESDGLRIQPPAAPKRGVEIDTYDDHRMAMAFSMAGHIVIRDPECVRKTYPDYFKDLAKLGMVGA